MNSKSTDAKVANQAVDDNPEWTEDDFQQARPASEVLPELYSDEQAEALLKPKRGRPPKQKPKRQVTLRLDSDVLDAFRSTGSGWQTGINQVLKDHLNDQHQR